MLGAFGGFTDEGAVDTRFGASSTGRKFQKRLVQYAGNDSSVVPPECTLERAVAGSESSLLPPPGDRRPLT